MSKSACFMFLEGKHEYRVLMDLNKNERIDYGLIGLPDDVEVEHEYNIPNNQVLSIAPLIEGYDYVVLILDKDVSGVNRQAKEAEKIFERNGIECILLMQYPFLETFLCACFKEFEIDTSLTMWQLKEVSTIFLANKFNIDLSNPVNRRLLKKITISDIEKKGGNISFARRYEKYFEILKIIQ